MCDIFILCVCIYMGFVMFVGMCVFSNVFVCMCVFYNVCLYVSVM